MAEEAGSGIKDYFKAIKEAQDKFKQNPRQGIINFLNSQERSIQRLPALDVKRLYLFKQAHKEYAEFIGKLMSEKTLDLEQLLNHNNSISIIQRIDESGATITEYTTEINELTALRLSRNYVSAMEIIWKQLKQLTRFAEFNKIKKHVPINVLLDDLSKIERRYNLKLTIIKSYVDSELRNFIGHESTIFHQPNQIIFLDIDNKEVRRLTTDEIYKLLFNAIIILAAFASVNNTALASKLELLLALNDTELDEFTTTGILTDAMQKKIEIKP